MGKAEIDAANEIYAVARQQADEELARLRSEMDAVRDESYALGVLKKIEYDRAHNEMLKYAVLHRIKQGKEYRKGGMTWAQFCEAIGESVKSVDKVLADLKPLGDKFSADFAELSGVGINKIRYLGRAISADSAEINDGCLVIDETKIPLDPEHKEEIIAAIDAIKDAHAKALEDAEASIRANKRVLDAKEHVIQKQEKEIKRLEERPKISVPEEEADFLEKAESWKKGVEAWLFQFDPSQSAPLPANASPRMRAALVEALGYFARQAVGVYREAVELFGEPDMDGPWDPNDFGTGAVFPEELENQRPGRKTPSGRS